MPDPNAPRCAVTGCQEAGEYKAPRTRDDLRDYQWLCLDHVREFNKQWNYFSGMEGDEIDAFMQDSLTGHRPTWQREEQLNAPESRRENWGQKLEDSMSRFFHWDEESIRNQARKRLPPKEKKALDALELGMHCTIPELKQHYRGMVKLYHPDLHRGDREREEKFKQINAAYTYLLKLYEKKAEQK